MVLSRTAVNILNMSLKLKTVLKVFVLYGFVVLSDDGFVIVIVGFLHRFID